MTRPLPPVTSDTQAWWDATREQRLLVQHCTSCGVHQHYPRALCTSCGATDLTFDDATGTGSIISFTVVHRAPSESFAPPYVVALVRLDESVQLLTNIVAAPEDVRCDQPVTVTWEALDDGRHLPLFTPTE
ncbi:MAG: OB-fold domain-containing protein [Actinobacteria bacterium]|nr:OB-fold domain-containing protein [Actinomycetota bacterium]